MPTTYSPIDESSYSDSTSFDPEEMLNSPLRPTAANSHTTRPAGHRYSLNRHLSTQRAGVSTDR